MLYEIKHHCIIVLKRMVTKTFLFNKAYAFIYRRKWRKKNQSNFTSPVSFPPLGLVEIGKGTYGNINVLYTPQEAKLVIGNYCSIADSVTFLLSLDHPLNHISTYPFKSMAYGCPEAISKGNIIIGDDVWIGYGAVILSGVKIGQGAVVAAGTVVTKDIPPYAVVAGVPARIVRYRFNSEVIRELVKVDWSNVEMEYVKNNLSDFYSDVTTDNVQTLVRKLPKTSIK